MLHLSSCFSHGCLKKREKQIIDNHVSKLIYSIKWWTKFMSGSCHLDRALNVKIDIQCKIFIISIFFNCSWVLQIGAHSRYYKGALTQKWSFLVMCTTFRSVFHVSWKNQNKHSTLNWSFDILSKWHEPDINLALNYQNW